MHSSRTLNVFWFLLCAVLLSSCSSVKLGYYAADEYLKYRLSSLLDLDNKQSQLAYKKIDSFYLWHQQEELDPIIGFAEDIKRATADKNIEPAEFNALYATITAGRARYLKKAIPDLVVLLETLSSDQVKQYRNNLEEQAQEYFDDELENTEAERLQERLADNIDTYEDWFGELSKEQIEFISESIDVSDTRLQQRIARHKALRDFVYSQLLEHRTDKKYMTALLHRYTADPEFFYQPQHKILQQLKEKASVNIPAFFVLLSWKQLRFFHERIDELIEDIESLKPNTPE